jgi:biotin carboxyl carrier protein
MGLSHDDVVKILNYIDESKFDELHLETGDLKLIVRRKGGPNYAPTIQVVESTPAPGRPGEGPKEPARQALAGGNESPADAPSRLAAVRPPAQPELSEEGLVPIRSTMLGVFYRGRRPL